MTTFHRYLLSAALISFTLVVAGCSGADNPKIADAPPPPPPTEEAKTKPPKIKYMENDAYKKGMERMEKAQQGR
ncbi:MAG: hypothetical protein NVSMB9_14240 [Isosphaeraceae bacterium]